MLMRLTNPHLFLTQGNSFDTRILVHHMKVSVSTFCLHSQHPENDYQGANTSICMNMQTSELKIGLSDRKLAVLANGWRCGLVALLNPTIILFSIYRPTNSYFKQDSGDC